MKSSRTIAWLLAGTAAVLMAARGADQERGEPPAGQGSPATLTSPAAVLIPVGLPLTGSADQQVMAAADKALKSLPSSDQRAIVIFEFQPGDAKSAGRSEFERALSLARFIASDRFSRVRTVAYVPASLEGHAVLPVLACEEIVISPDAQFGAAGRGESSVDATMRAAYQEIAARRRTIPVPIVLGMLEPGLEVIEVQLVGGGTSYVLQEELESLRKDAQVWKESTIVPAGELAVISGQEMRLKFGFASHLAADRKELAEALQIAPDAIRDDVAIEQAWTAVRIDVRGRLVPRSVDDVVRAVRDVQQEQTANLVCLWVDSPGGPAAAALRLVNLLAELDSKQLRSVAYVEAEARSVAALVALMADETYVREGAILGGPGDTNIEGGELSDLRAIIQTVAQARNRDWSLLVGLVDPQLKVFRYRLEGTGTVRYFCEEELQQQQEPAQWKQEAELKLSDGIAGTQAKELGLVADTADSFEAALQHFNLRGEITIAQRNAVVSGIERLASQPWFGRTLLFIAFFALISEASTPGLGVAGFISGVSFLLFFWCQFLNGTAGWLELVLFAGGLTCIALEIFVIPGFGVFGVGGGVMVLLSIILASQTFVFPRNTYQLDQVPGSLFSMLAACGGIFAALWFMRHFLVESRLFGRLVLSPPSEDVELGQLEAMVDWGYLQGKRGMTTTQLTPSGKARFGDDVVNVISDGILVPRDTPVHVVQVLGNRVLVEPLDES